MRLHWSITERKLVVGFAAALFIAGGYAAAGVWSTLHDLYGTYVTAICGLALTLVGGNVAEKWGLAKAGLDPRAGQPTSEARVK